MYRNILIATDGSDYASCAVEHGLELAKSLNAHVVFVTVTEPWTDALSAKDVLAYSEIEYDAEMTKRASHTLAAVAVRAKAHGVACEAVHVCDQEPADGILAAATEHGCDLIVMASHGRRGLQRLMFGSQTHRVLAKTTLPVLVCR
jgi:nucleotide-binding universal stress UspA family protein